LQARQVRAIEALRGASWLVVVRQAWHGALSNGGVIRGRRGKSGRRESSLGLARQVWQIVLRSVVNRRGQFRQARTGKSWWVGVMQGAFWQPWFGVAGEARWFKAGRGQACLG
jgi:hypothetical protein